MTTILILDNQEVTFDTEDLPLFNSRPWRINHLGYISYKSANTRNYKFHREILKVTDISLDVDHINGNKLDNRKSNLRVCSHQLNCFNGKAKQMETKTSRYKGVNWHKSSGKWCASIGVNYKKLHLTSSPVEEECAYAYNLALKKIAGEFACLNPLDETIFTEETKTRLNRIVNMRLQNITLKYT